MRVGKKKRRGRLCNYILVKKNKEFQENILEIAKDKKDTRVNKKAIS